MLKLSDFYIDGKDIYISNKLFIPMLEYGPIVWSSFVVTNWSSQHWELLQQRVFA
uniref:Uncharacterized protein n=1 Tax=Tetranychus urticae TaxID=32264 RepID=T1K9B5_TETUR